MNVGADLVSRQEVIHGDWKLHPDVVNQIWERFYEAEVDLFASKETMSPLLLTDSSSPPGSGRHGPVLELPTLLGN